MAMKRSSSAAAVAAAVSLVSASLLAQTAIKLPKNKYTPKQDVELGREAAAEVRRQYPIIQNDQISAYLTRLGDRLIAGAPPELKDPVYEFSFTPVNLKEINAFALPGGPMFVHRGMIEAAAGEAEVAGVMAHELSHVLLRHGTANATKAQNPWLQIGQIAGALGGAVVGGAMGSYIAQGSQFGLGTLLLRYSRDFEKQADLLGAQIMARAGYDPRALAHMFETINKEAESAGGSGPQWMSDHPNPGNRTQYLNQEAERVSIVGTADVSGFEPIKKSFASLGPAKSMSEMAKAKDTGGGGSGGSASGNAGGQSLQTVGTPGQAVPRPSTQFHTMNGGKVFHASVPVDWTAIPSKQSIKVVPQNGYGPLNGETVFSHGVEFGLAKASSRDLRQATDALLQAFAQGNPELRAGGAQQATRISERSAIVTPLVNSSPLGGQEHITVSTTFLADGSMFYYLTVVPVKDEPGFQDAFRQIGASIRLTEVPR
ncbi:MAG TPA: M48 family metalloprotease [Vicinamibacterales bacterium]|jgi:Zn-dependent protease with chaperone function